MYRSKFSRSPVIVICHNVMPHESHWWHKPLTKMALSLSTHYLVPSIQDKMRLTELIPQAKHAATVMEFPSYSDVVSNTITKTEARSVLGLDPELPVLLVFWDNKTI